MQKFTRLLTLLLPSIFSSLLLAGCLGGGGSGSSVQASLGTAEFSSLEVVTYDSLVAKLRIKGALKVTGENGLYPVDFYADSLCAMTSIGHGLSRDLTDAGVEIQVSSTGITRIYMKTSTMSDCFYMTDFVPHYAAPPGPTLTSTSPLSPSRFSHEPLVVGSVSEATTLVRLFDDVACTHQVASGSPNTFRSVGIQASLQPDQTSTLYGVAFDAFGKPSPCTVMGTFKHSSVGASIPQFASMTPVSPSSTVLNPILIGTVGADSETVGVYSDAACSTLVKEGTADVFRTTGLELLVTENSTTNFYGRSVEQDGLASDCGFLTIYVHDAVAPSAPVFVSTTPASPTRVTLVPRIRGTAPTDAQLVRLFQEPTCVTPVGSGTKTVFETTGISTAIRANEITTLYAASVDAAGNNSTCALMTTFAHDTLPPDPPIFAATIPASPNNFSTTPRVEGTVDISTVTVEIFRDETCSLLIGSGQAGTFENPGIPVSVTGNTTTTLFAHALDEAGNISDCTALTNYAHSTVPAPSPSFFQSVPSSPSRLTHTPYIVGTAANTIAKVTLYGNAVCSIYLGSASRSAFTTVGIQASVAQNSKTDIYAISEDVYGNVSPCVLLTSYIHNTVAPLDPVFISLAPLSPNSTSITPTIRGSITFDPSNVLPVSEVYLYDSFLCLNRIGTGTPAQLANPGIQASVGANSQTPIYARSFDAAGNVSNCTLFANYIHDALIPGRPVLQSITPMTPSYTSETKLVATIGATTDFLEPINVVVYSDSACTTQIANGTPALLSSSGLPINVVKNATTTLFGATFNIVGTASPCTALINYAHNDVGPSGLMSTQVPDGSVTLNWNPDSTASPIPSYTLRRSIVSGGPYTTIAKNIPGSTYRDVSVTNGQTYYYVVAASNNTGTSKNSAEVSISVSVAVPDGPIGLVASPGPQSVSLAWSGYSSTLSYSVLRSTQSGGPYTEVAKNLVSASYTNTNLANGIAYYYVVVAHNPAGTSLQSNEASATPLSAPSTPINLTITNVLSTPSCGGSSGVILSWTAPSYFTTFVINRGAYSNPGIQYVTTTGTSYVDCSPAYYGSSPNFNYYNVTATWGSEVSATSNQVVFSNDGSPVVKVNPGNGQNIVTWTAMNAATRYRLYRSTTSKGPYTLVNGNITSTSYTDGSLSNGTAYFYVLYSEYSNGGLSWPSLEVSGVPGPNPSAPAHLTMTMSATKTPVLTWSTPASYNSFNIYRSANAGGPYSYLAQSSSATYTDNAPIAGLNYYYVKTAWGSFESAASNTVVYRFGIPSLLTITPSMTDMTLTWSATAGADSFTVYRSSTSGGPYTVVATPTANNYIDTNVLTDTAYYYTVRANFPDLTSGENSAEVSGMLNQSANAAGLTVTGTTNSGVSLAWARMTGASTYRIYRATASAGPYTMVQTTSATAYTMTGLVSQTEYFFRVSAVRSGVESGVSNTVSALTRATPSGPQVIGGAGIVAVSWGTVVNALSYNVLRSTDAINFTTIASGLTLTSHNDSTVVNGQMYFYRFEAQFSSETRQSTNSSAVTPGTSPRVPSGLTVIGNSTGDQLDLNWGAVSGVTAYRLYMATVSGGPYSQVLQTTSTTDNSVTALNSGTTYYFAVSALIGSIESAKSSEVAAIPRLTPTAPLASMNGINVAVSWPAIAGASTYNIYRSSDRSNFSSIATSVVGTNYSDTTTTNGITYTYKYLPVSSAGVSMSLSQPSATVTPDVAPETPQNLLATTNGTTSVNLTWTAVPNTTTYSIFRSTTSGSGYNLIATIASSVTAYSNSGLSAGTAYFYVITADSSSGVRSVYSNEASVRLISPPTGLAANSVANSINLSWAAVGGASNYRISRAETSSGPYGVIASSVVGTSYQDFSIANGVTYYYVASAQVSGVQSINSSEVSATGIRAMNLQVPIELVDQGISSNTTNTTFERTRTTLNTSNYDGTVTYFFEAVATNQDNTARAINLVNSAGSSVASINIPATTNSPTRFRVAMTPTAGSNNYRVQTSATSTSGKAEVFSARMLVNQINATKTKIYVPLLSSSSGNYSGDANAYVESASSEYYSELQAASIYLRDTSKLATLPNQNAWELETLVGVTGTATGSTGLYNTTTSDIVEGTESTFTAAGPTLVRSPFSEGTNGFSTANEGHQYQIAVRCLTNCMSGGAVLYKAGLWVRLSSMDKVQILYRTSFGANLSSPAVLESQRTLIDLSLFSNPTVKSQSVGSLMMSGTATTLELMDLLTTDSGTTGTAVVGSDNSISEQTKSIHRSPAVSITSGRRFAPHIAPGNATYRHVDSAIVVEGVR